VEDLQLLGDPLEALRVADFRPGMNAAIDPGLLPRWARWLLRVDSEHAGLFQAVATGWFGRQLLAYPQAGETCTGCGFCARHCPAEAIALVDGRARMDTHACIRCYCCHELCPEDAVELRRTPLGRMLVR